MAQMMGPVEIVQVVGMANALWRLGHERFDSVLLDVDLVDRRVIRRCREQIADIAAVPVLDLADPPEAMQTPPSPRPARQDARRAAAAAERQALRLPWQRRSRRPAATPLDRGRDRRLRRRAAASRGGERLTRARPAGPPAGRRRPAATHAAGSARRAA